MTTMLRIALAGLLSLAAAIPAVHAQESGKRVALIIGNDAYAISPLKNAVNDARAIDAALRASNFRTILVENARKADMEYQDRRVPGSVGTGRYRALLLCRTRRADRQ